VEGASTVRVVSIFSTNYRYVGTSHSKNLRRGHSNRLELDLDRLTDFYGLIQQQFVEVLIVMPCPAGSLSMPTMREASDKPTPHVSRADLWLFLLPSDEVVAALAVTFDPPSGAEYDPLTIRVLESCVSADVTINGVKLSQCIEDAAAQVGVVHIDENSKALPPERHQLVIISEMRRSYPHQFVSAALRVHHPESTSHSDRPPELNQDDRALTLTSRITILHGYPEYAQNVFLLTAVQLIGAAVRLRRIWFTLGRSIKEFSDNNLSPDIGVQKRGDLEVLLDELGNLELDFGYSIEYQSQISSLVPSEFMRSYYAALGEQLELTNQIEVISRLFDRVGRSVRSEMAAIEIREQRTKARRNQSIGVVGLVLLSIGIPLVFLFLLFGINGSEVNSAYSIFDMRHYALVYSSAFLLSLIPFIFLVVLAAEHRRGR
jgi:hypothetical protein